MPLIPALRRQRQANLCEFEASLVYKSYFQVRVQSYRETLSRKNKQTNKQKRTSYSDNGVAIAWRTNRLRKE